MSASIGRIPSSPSLARYAAACGSIKRLAGLTEREDVSVPVDGVRRHCRRPQLAASPARDGDPVAGYPSPVRAARISSGPRLISGVHGSPAIWRTESP